MKVRTKTHYCLHCRMPVTLEKLKPLQMTEEVDWILENCPSDEWPTGMCPKCDHPCWPKDRKNAKKRLSNLTAPAFTSLWAYAHSNFAPLRERIVRIHMRARGYGANMEECRNSMGEPFNDSITPRYPELEQAWRLRNTGHPRNTGKTKNPKFVYVACPKVEAATKDPRFKTLFDEVDDAQKRKDIILKEVDSIDREIKRLRENVYQEVYRVYGPEWPDEWQGPGPDSDETVEDEDDDN